jgi:hypothetical protein
VTEQLRSLRYDRDLREHGAEVTTRPWWNAPGEESRDQRYAWSDVEVTFCDSIAMTEVKLESVDWVALSIKDTGV